MIFIVPEHFVGPISHNFQMVIGLGCRGEHVDFAILVLEDDLSAVFVRKHPQNRVVGFVLHYHVLIFNVVEFQLGSVVETDQKSFIQEILNYLLIGL